MAEREGFDPSMRFVPHQQVLERTRLVGLLPFSEGFDGIGEQAVSASNEVGEGDGVGG
jgi:hypothetical protein